MVSNRRWDAGEAIRVVFGRRSCRRVGLTYRGNMMNLSEEVSRVLVSPVMVLELEGVTGGKSATVTGAGYLHITCFLFLHTKLSYGSPSSLVVYRRDSQTVPGLGWLPDSRP